MFHYTWGTVFKDSFGKKIWEFDKRTYTDEIIQREVSMQVWWSIAIAGVLKMTTLLSGCTRLSGQACLSAALLCERGAQVLWCAKWLLVACCCQAMPTVTHVVLVSRRQ